MKSKECIIIDAYRNILHRDPYKSEYVKNLILLNNQQSIFDTQDQLELKLRLEIIAKGDINNNGTITGADVVYLASYLAGIPGYPIPSERIVSDINMDNIVSAADVVYLSSYIARLPGFTLPKLQTSQVIDTLIINTQWKADVILDTMNDNDFKFYILYNSTYTNPRDVVLVTHGQTGFNPEKSISIYNNYINYITSNNNIDSRYDQFVFMFPTTKTQAYGIHSLSLYETDYSMGDYAYMLVGYIQIQEHLEYLSNNSNYNPNINKIIASGYSDGAWMSSILGFFGIAAKVVSHAGFPIKLFDEWHHLIPENAYNRDIDLYFSNGDFLYNGQDMWFDPGEMPDGIANVANFFNCNDIDIVYVQIGELTFKKTIYTNDKNNNKIIFYLHEDVHSSHSTIGNSPNTMRITFNNGLLTFLEKDRIEELSLPRSEDYINIFENIIIINGNFNNNLTLVIRNIGNSPTKGWSNNIWNGIFSLSTTETEIEWANGLIQDKFELIHNGTKYWLSKLIYADKDNIYGLTEEFLLTPNLLPNEETNFNFNTKYIGPGKYVFIVDSPFIKNNGIVYPENNRVISDNKYFIFDKNFETIVQPSIIDLIITHKSYENNTLNITIKNQGNLDSDGYMWHSIFLLSETETQVKWTNNIIQDTFKFKHYDKTTYWLSELIYSNKDKIYGNEDEFLLTKSIKEKEDITINFDTKHINPGKYVFVMDAPYYLNGCVYPYVDSLNRYPFTNPTNRINTSRLTLGSNYFIFDKHQ